MARYKYLSAPLASPDMPKGIKYIVGNEAAERFSFYGMKAILTVFMTKHLMAADGTADPMTGDDAKFWVHQFVAFSYFFPIIGAIVADWLLGKYRTIIGLSLVYCAGHLALALDETRLGLTLGLSLIAIGAGGIKPCVSAHVGDQFGQQNARLLPKVFSWFYFSINLGAFMSTLLTPKLLEWYGPHVAFGVPGALMLLATWVFWLGRRKFIHVPPHGKQVVQEAFTGEGWRALRNLAMIYVFVAMFWALFDQTASAWVLQAESMDRTILGYEVLSSQLQAINPILVLTLIPIFTYVIYPALDKLFRLTPLRKVSIGFFITVAAFAISAKIETDITGGRIVKLTSQANAEVTPASNLLRATDDLTGWVSAPEQDYLHSEKSQYPQEIVVRLRERKAWEISSVSINPAADLAEYLKLRQNNDKEFAASPAEQYWAKEIEVLVSDSRKGDWKSVARTTLKQQPAAQSVEFPPVTTPYVMIRIHSNWGADAVAMGSLAVNATTGTAPGDAHEHAQAVWPNVAATGHKPAVSWQFLAYLILTSAEIMVSITCLEFSYTQAPRKVKSFVMALYLLSVSAGNEFTSVVNKVIQNEDGTSKLPGASYYWFFTGAMLVTAVVFIFVAQRYRGQTYIQQEDDGSAAAEET